VNTSVQTNVVIVSKSSSTVNVNRHVVGALSATMTAKTNAVKNVHLAPKIALRNVLILDALRNAERSATNAQNHVRSDVNTVPALNFVLKYVIDNHANCLVRKLYLVVMLVLDSVENHVHKYVEKKVARITTNKHLRSCLELRMTLKLDL
jgi:hypothetical protein